MPIIDERLRACWGSTSWAQSTAYVVFAVVIYFIVAFTYRLTLHPLAKYPGPFFARITDWPLVAHCIKGDRHLWEYKNHQKYGQIVRYGANSISISTPSSIPLIHGPKANVKKGAWYKTLDISAGAPSVQMEIDKHQHAMRRRFLAPAFSERALKEAEKLITITAKKLSANLSEGGEKDWSQPKKFSDWATFFGFDFIIDLGYGKSLDMLDKEDNRWVPDTLKSASVFLYYSGYLPFIDFVRPLMGTRAQDYIGGQTAADSLRFTNMANSRLADRMEQEKTKAQADSQQTGTDRKDTFHYLLNSKDPVTGKSFTTQQLQADSALIIAAGSDGVGLTIGACMFYLLTNPTVLARLTEEIRGNFSSVDEIKNPKLGALSLPREVLKGGLKLDDHFIPQGITVGSPTYVIHHDPTIFPEPWYFRPERWIASSDGNSPGMVSAAKAASIPFLIGPLNCIGKNMSYIALKLALAYVLFENDLRVSGELTGGGSPLQVEERRRVGEYQMEDWILGFRDGPMVEVKVRS
ncbi:Cytochrome P450 monooxygenase [Lachnellula occidentalis]|uniref:Cytochrome P450 monooxygenase n=1 Tax=Lachnellula occidentalis TaxID=215460 RepID=A0A8H8UDF3_9HELO|nr:Cytochrome P450 monooxygenase [Lachnellula occidentalis]